MRRIDDNATVLTMQCPVLPSVDTFALRKAKVQWNQGSSARIVTTRWPSSWPWSSRSKKELTCAVGTGQVRYPGPHNGAELACAREAVNRRGGAGSEDGHTFRSVAITPIALPWAPHAGSLPLSWRWPAPDASPTRSPTSAGAASCPSASAARRWPASAARRTSPTRPARCAVAASTPLSACRWAAGNRCATSRWCTGPSACPRWAVWTWTPACRRSGALGSRALQDAAHLGCRAAGRCRPGAARACHARGRHRTRAAPAAGKSPRATSRRPAGAGNTRHGRPRGAGAGLRRQRSPSRCSRACWSSAAACLGARASVPGGALAKAPGRGPAQHLLDGNPHPARCLGLELLDRLQHGHGVLEFHVAHQQRAHHGMGVGFQGVRLLLSGVLGIAPAGRMGRNEPGSVPLEGQCRSPLRQQPARPSSMGSTPARTVFLATRAAPMQGLRQISRLGPCRGAGRPPSCTGSTCAHPWQGPAARVPECPQQSGGWAGSGAKRPARWTRKRHDPWYGSDSLVHVDTHQLWSDWAPFRDTS